MAKTTVRWETTHRIIVEKSNHKPPIYKAMWIETNVFEYLKGDWRAVGGTAQEAVQKLFTEYPKP